MIILDTNVISVLMQSAPDKRVIAWLDARNPSSVWTTSITVFEVRMGLALLAKGKRRALLEEAFTRALDEALQGRVLPFDAAAAKEAAELAVARQRKGRTVDFRDTQIAGIALARKGTIATRNIRHFADLGARAVDPWESEA